MFIRLILSLAPIPLGTIDLTDLYRVEKGKTKGSAIFQIPNRKWLVDNQWISGSSDDDSPLFLQSLQLFVPPGSLSKFAYSVHTSLQLAGLSTLKGKQDNLPHTVMETQYLEKSGKSYCADPLPNLFSNPDCANHYQQVTLPLLPYQIYMF